VKKKEKEKKTNTNGLVVTVAIAKTMIICATICIRYVDLKDSGQQFTITSRQWSHCPSQLSLGTRQGFPLEYINTTAIDGDDLQFESKSPCRRLAVLRPWLQSYEKPADNSATRAADSHALWRLTSADHSHSRSLLSMDYTLPDHSLSCPTPVPSPNIPLPAVFIFPPEEEQYHNPPWCLLDATDAQDQDLSRVPDFGFLDAALTALPPSPSAIMASSSQEKGTRLRIVLPARSDPAHLRDTEQQVSAGEGSAIDSPIAGTQPSKKLKSLKSRAFKALQSIKNVGKASAKKNSPVPSDAFPSSENGRWSFYCDSVESLSIEPHPEKRLNLTRRASVIFSQLLPPIERIRPRTFSEGVSQRPMQNPQFSDSEPVFARPPSPSPPSEPSLAHPGSPSKMSPEQHVRSKSPLSSDQPPGSRTRKLFRTSMLNLHHIFISPSASSDPAADATVPFSPVSPSRSSTAPSTSTEASSEMPMTPPAADADMSFPAFRQDVLGKPKFGAGGGGGGRGQGFGLHMRLESFHFDSLAFDANTF
jgi:hypothetical protein